MYRTLVKVNGVLYSEMYIFFLSKWRVLDKNVIFLNFYFTQITIAVAWLPGNISRFQVGRAGRHCGDLVRGGKRAGGDAGKQVDERDVKAGRP